MRMRVFMQSHYGRIIIALILGFGLSTLFRKTCKEKQCMRFEGPSLDEIEGQTYDYNDKCYRFKPNAVNCSSSKKTVRFA